MQVISTGDMATPPVLSILMLVSNGERWERFMKDRLQEMGEIPAEHSCPFEVVLVVNGVCDADRLIEDVRERPFPVTVVLHGVNHIPRARNLAVRRARGEFVLVWDDDDTLRTPAVIPEFLERYRSLPLGVLCAELQVSDGSCLHPQTPSLMPQYRWEEHRVMLTGMQHTPFITRRSIAAAFPLSEVRRLRGEWVEWSTRLWRAGLPIGYLLPSLAIFKDQNGKGLSATRNGSALEHTLTSMLALSYEYGIFPETFSGDILYRRYAREELEAHTTTPMEAWAYLLETGRSLENASGTGGCFGGAEKQFSAAWNVTVQSRTLLHAGRERIKQEAVYNVGPFGIFEPNDPNLLRHCLAMARRRLLPFGT